MGNTDEMLVRPDSLEEFASQSSAPPALWQVLTQIALATRSTLGDERMAWLRELPRVKIHGSSHWFMALLRVAGEHLQKMQVTQS
jgi:hypothetical protein